MTDQEETAFQYLSKQVPNGYRINELIYFSYPVRKIMLQVQANKEPDQTLSRIYHSILRTVQAGISNRNDVIFFLGIDPLDEFMARELIQMRERELLDFVGDDLVVTSNGSAFICDHTFFRVIESEKFTFLLDGLADEVISFAAHPPQRNPLERSLKCQLDYPLKSPELVKDRFDSISQVYKQDHQGTAYLIGYDDDRILQDYSEWLTLILIEYIPTVGSRDPRIEIRRPQEGYPKMEAFTKLFNQDYRHLLFELTDSDRPYAQEDLADQTPEVMGVTDVDESYPDDVITNLGIWETKKAFEDVLATTKARLLIESPWIKWATQQYLPAFERLANQGVRIYILFGIDETADHHHGTMRKLEQLASRYPTHLTLVSLPDHFAENGIAGKHGTHRKLVIKDDELYISGSFNFLSFNQREGESIANEETYLIRRDVGKKWAKVIGEYGLEGKIRV